MTFHQTTKLTAAQRSAIRAGAQSLPRSCSKFSTGRSDNGNRMYIITAKRMISGDVLK